MTSSPYRYHARNSFPFGAEPQRKPIWVAMNLRAFGQRVRPIEVRRVIPEGKKADAALLTSEHRQWREAVCDRAGWRCQWIENGQRCKRSRARGDRMIADHIVERADGGAPLDPTNGQCLCVQHNTLKGVQARAARR